MHRHNDPLTKVLHLFSPLHHMSSPVVVRDDLVMETDIGCFGLAYSKSTNTAALFYARDADAFDTKTQADGTRDYVHKDRLLLVKMYPLFHGAEAKWDHGDQRMQFDLTHVREDISHLMDKLPRAQIRETCLHRTGKFHSASVFVAFRVVPSESDPDLFNVYISTKSNENFRLFDNNHESHADHPASGGLKKIVTAFKRAERELVRRGLANEFMLRAYDSATGEKKSVFTLKELPEAIETTFSKMQQQIRKGTDPVRLKDQPIWPVIRAGSYISDKIEEFTETARHDPEALLRKLGLLALDMKDAGLSVLGKAALEMLGESTAKQKRHHVTPAWHKLIKDDEKRFISMHSATHELLAIPNPQEFGDLEPLSSEKHVCSFAHSPLHLKQVTPMDTFNHWLRSIIIAPYDSTFEYRGDKHHMVHPSEIDKVKAIHVYAANGVVGHYVPDTKQAYFYYHRPDQIQPNHHLHSQAYETFNAGRVLRIDAGRPDSFVHSMSFDKFARGMRTLTGKPDLQLPSADKPEKPAPMPPAWTLGPSIAHTITPP